MELLRIAVAAVGLGLGFIPLGILMWLLYGNDGR